MQKGASNAARGSRPNKSFRCTHVARQIAIKAKYHLWVNAPERDAIARILSTCPCQQLPTDAQASTATTAPTVGSTVPRSAASPPPGVTPKPAASTTPAPAATGHVYCPNCTAARAAGAASIHAGSQGTPASSTVRVTVSPASSRTRWPTPGQRPSRARPTTTVHTEPMRGRPLARRLRRWDSGTSCRVMGHMFRTKPGDKDMLVCQRCGLRSCGGPSRCATRPTTPGRIRAMNHHLKIRYR